MLRNFLWQLNEELEIIWAASSFSLLFGFGFWQLLIKIDAQSNKWTSGKPYRIDMSALERTSWNAYPVFFLSLVRLKSKGNKQQQKKAQNLRARDKKKNERKMP